MKKILFSLLLIAGLTSCYKDYATFTTEVTGSDKEYTISYQNEHGDWINGQSVKNGWCFYDEHQSDWRLKMNVYGKDIKVNVYKRTHLKYTFTGTDSLILNIKIDHDK